MKKNFTLKVGFAVCIFMYFSSSYLTAQDVHFTQFQGASLNINPALAGATECDHCYTGQLKRQWQNIPVDYRTFSGTYDRKFRTRSDKGWFGGGLIFNYDIAGDSRLSGLHLGLIGSYVRKINKRNILSLGLQLAGTQRSFDLDGLEFDDQWGPYNIKDDILTLGASEELFEDVTARYGGVSGGLNWAYAHPRKRLRFNAGLGAFHLNRPDKSYKNKVKVKQEIRYAVHGAGTIPVTKRFDVLLQALHQIQGPHGETVLGAYLRGHLNQRPTHETALQIGLLYRLDDAFAPAVGLLWKQWEAGFAYDINISDLDEVSDNKGGPEFYIKYCIKPAPELRPCPLCPKRM